MVTLIKYGALGGGEKYNVNQMWIDGLSTDSKPTTTIDGMGIPNGSAYTEVDTGKTYMFDKENTTWYEVSIGGGGGTSGLASKDIGAMTGYAKAQTAGAIGTSDTLNQAIGKVEKRVDDNENNISSLAAEQARNKLKYTIDTLKAINTMGVWNDNTYSLNMIDFTINDDMSISVSGHVSDTNTVFLLAQNIDITPYNTDILSGCPVGGGDNLYAIRIAQAVSPWATMAADTGDSTTIVNISTNCNVYISIRNITNTLQFKPMICSAINWELTHAYQPYTPTNTELTGRVKAHSEGGTDYDVINGIRVYVSATQPTGDIPVGSLWIGG